MNKSSGFTLVIVLIITSIASVVVLSTLRDSVNLERLSGNFQKKLNAKLMSEKGIFTSMEQLQASVLDDPTISLSDLVGDNATMSGDGNLAGSQFNGTVKIDDDGNILMISQGNRFEGEESMQAVFEFIPATTGGTTSTLGFPTGVVSCKNIDASGNAIIDSYDSTLGDYDAYLADGTKNSGQAATVKLLGDDGEVKLGGSKSAIYGEVFSAGNLIIDKATITGNVISNGSLTVDNKSYIGGNATAYTDYTQQGKSTVAGDITANGVVSIDKKATVNGEIRSGEGLVEKTFITITSTDADFSCDFLSLREEVAKITPDSDLPDLDVDYTLTLGSNEAVGDSSIKASAAVFLDVATNIYFFDDVEIKNKSELKIAENEHVVMFVDGDFSLKSGTITIPENSSLTLIANGKVEITANADFNAPASGITADGRPIFSIYSAYENSNGVKLQSGKNKTPLYAVVYAPYTEVEISGQGAFKGTILAKSINNKGEGIHYDTALSEASFGGTTGSTSGTTAGKLVFKQWIYSPLESDDESDYNDDDDD